VQRHDAALASVNTMIEFTHRITSGLSFFSVVALLGGPLPARCAATWRARLRGFGGVHAD
jgi:heme A synthase